MFRKLRADKLESAIASTLSGLIITWTGRYRELLLIGWALWAIGLGLISTLHPGSHVSAQIGYSLLAGIGVGGTLQPSLIAIQGAVPRKTMAVVTAARNFIRNLGGALGLALTGTIVQSYLRPYSVSLDGFASANNPEAQGAYRQGFRVVFLLMAGLGATGFVTAFFLLRHQAVDREDDEKLKVEPEEMYKQNRS